MSDRNPFRDRNPVWHWLMLPARFGWWLADAVTGRRWPMSDRHDSVVPREVVVLEDAIHDTVVAALDAGVSADRIVSVVARALVPDNPRYGRGAR